MPSTINGCGTGYWGKRNVATVDLHCEDCNKVTPHISYDTHYCFVIFFLPVIPLSRKRILDQCSRCKRHHLLSLKEYGQGKLEALKQVTLSYQSDPGSLDKVSEFISTIVSYRDEALFNQAASELERVKSSSPEVLELLADGHSLFKNAGDCERCLRAALRLQESDDRHVKLVYNLIDQQRPADALPHVACVLQGKREELMGTPVSLVYAFQAEGLHEQALALLDRIVGTFPELAENKDLTAARKLSTKHRSTGKKKPPKGWNRAGKKVKEGTRFPLHIALPVCLIAIYLSYCWAGGTHDVHVINGTKTTYQVTIGERNINLIAGRRTKISIDEGTIPVVFTNPNGVEVRQEFKIETFFFTRIFNDDVYVLNPDRTALILEETAYYAVVERSDYEPKTKLVCNELFRVFEDIDYVFRALPKTVMVEEGQVVEKKGLSQYVPETNEMALTALLQLGEEGDLKTYLNQVMAFDNSDMEMILFYSALVDPAGALSLLEPRLSGYPVDLEAHRTYQSLHSYQDPELVDRYRRMLETDPDNGDLLYLSARICLDAKEETALLKRASQATPPSARAMNALGFSELSKGKFTEGLLWVENAIALDPDNSNLKQLHEQFLLAAKQYDRLIDLGQQQLASNRKNRELASNLYLWMVLAERSIKETDIKALVPSSAEDQRAWRSSFQSLADYSKGDLEAIAASSEAGSYESSLRLRGKLDDSCLENSYDFEYLLAVTIKARHQGNTQLANKALAISIEELAQMSKYFPLLGEILAGTDPQRILTFSMEPEIKRTMLLAVGQQHPSLRKRCFELARKLNYSRTFPYLIVKEVLEGQ